MAIGNRIPLPPPIKKKFSGVYKHGHKGRNNQTREYSSWEGMRKRCKPGSGTYAEKNGLVVCNRWQTSFVDFLEDMGPMPPSPPRRTIERKDNTKGYSCGHCDDCKSRGEPANCCWATYSQQRRNCSHNHLITFQGQTRCVTDWAKITGINHYAILGRLKLGWPIEKALTQPIRPQSTRKRLQK